MVNSLSWSDLVGSAPEAAVKAKPTRPSYSVSTWTTHKCESVHRSGEAFLKCAASWFDNGMKLTKTARFFTGVGEWAVVHEHYSGDYFTTHNNKKLNHGHMVQNMFMFETYEEACDYLTQGFDNTSCYIGTCSGRCYGLSRKIIHVKL